MHRCSSDRLWDFFFQPTKSLSTKGRRILKSLDFIEKKSSLTGGEY